jgi:hypothetical protein
MQLRIRLSIVAMMLALPSIATEAWEQQATDESGVLWHFGAGG